MGCDIVVTLQGTPQSGKNRVRYRCLFFSRKERIKKYKRKRKAFHSLVKMYFMVYSTILKMNFHCSIMKCLRYGSDIEAGDDESLISSLFRKTEQH
ncbi:hypothetical protein DICVIV_01663 [Dictyocaulus viviparus]|uniref:Uncharacterized protein n=1 Tax=Dictyocaulus viviparus TaxID=29172 RepID=A0A0D8Y5T8_DICVI|nr:hypothetical protein DICVIV_01663 [Dictyocaulus viviparus]